MNDDHQVSLFLGVPFFLVAFEEVTTDVTAFFTRVVVVFASFFPDRAAIPIFLSPLGG